jgi:SAM-dependent methyltransferase
VTSWFESFFDDDWLRIAVDRDDDRTPHEVDFLLGRLALDPGGCVLDVACGHGRHALELARRGYRVTGVDLSAPSLELARRNAAEAGADIDYIHGDMRELPWRAEFDGAFNLFSSFGYFESQPEDERVVGAVARALRPGGRFVLDVVNPPALFSRFTPKSWDTAPDGRLTITEVDYDVRSGRNLQTWTIVRPDGSRVTKWFSVRMYTAPELEAMLGHAGLAVVELHGGFDGAELTREAWRLIVTAERPSA